MSSRCDGSSSGTFLTLACVTSVSSQYTAHSVRFSANCVCSNTQERKPVTNSRDTQELLPDAGQEMLRIFHTHPARTSLLQDFAFYEVSERILSYRHDIHLATVASNSKGPNSGSFSGRRVAGTSASGYSGAGHPDAGYLPYFYRSTPLRHVKPDRSRICRSADGDTADEHGHGHEHGHGYQPDAANADEHGYALCEPSCYPECHAKSESRPIARWRTELHEPPWWWYARVLRCKRGVPFPSHGGTKTVMYHHHSLRSKI